MKNLGWSEEIAVLRRRKGLTMGELAQLAGCHRNTIINAENGKNTIKLITLADILAALGMEMRILIVPVKKSALEEVK